MRTVLFERLRQGHRTVQFPGPIRLPERYRGWPQLDPARCQADCAACTAACPTGALTSPLRVDLARCTLCGRCQETCAAGAIAFSGDYRVARCSRDELVLPATTTAADVRAAAPTLSGRIRRLFGRSFKLRQVSAGGCNGCEVELAVSGTVVFDLGRFGIQFVASPRHADAIVVTGPVTKNMELALRETLAAVPPPRLVIASGTCATSGGVFAGSSAVVGGIPRDISVDLFVPGCPPHPWTFIHGLLLLLGEVEHGDRAVVRASG